MNPKCQTRPGFDTFGARSADFTGLKMRRITRGVSCVDGPRLARDHLACSAEVACSHVSGLLVQSGWTAGPDGVREPSPHHSNGTIEKQLMAWHKSNPVSQRLASVPGIGPIIATALAATVVEPSGFRSGRECAAWLGLVPRQNSTGGKHRLGGISKRGNQYLRRLPINGASANLLRSKATNADPWVIGLRQRRPSLVVAVALANKTARIA